MFCYVLGIVISIPIDKTVRPVIQPYRKMPIPLEERVDSKLAELEAMGVIEKVIGPSLWVSPMVIDGSHKKEIRICLDLRQANKAVLREHYPLPTIENMLPRMNGSNWFSHLDLRMAYYQFQLAEESRYITTFITKKGLYRYVTD